MFLTWKASLKPPPEVLLCHVGVTRSLGSIRLSTSFPGLTRGLLLVWRPDIQETNSADHFHLSSRPLATQLSLPRWFGTVLASLGPIWSRRLTPSSVTAEQNRRFSKSPLARDFSAHGFRTRIRHSAVRAEETRTSVPSTN